MLGRNLAVSFSPRSFVFPLFRAMKAYCLFLKISLRTLSEDLNYIRHLVDVCFTRPSKCCGIIYVWLCKNTAKDCLRENIQFAWATAKTNCLHMRMFKCGRYPYVVLKKQQCGKNCFIWNLFLYLQKLLWTFNLTTNIVPNLYDILLWNRTKDI